MPGLIRQLPPLIGAFPPNSIGNRIKPLFSLARENIARELRRRAMPRPSFTAGALLMRRERELAAGIRLRGRTRRAGLPRSARRDRAGRAENASIASFVRGHNARGISFVRRIA